MAANFAFPGRRVGAVTGDFGLGYIMDNLEAPILYNLGLTVIHPNNDGDAGYGPGFCGKGQESYTRSPTSSDKFNATMAVEDIGMHAERVTDPADIAPCRA